MRSVFKDAGDEIFFRKHGYVLKNLIPQETIDRIKAEFAGLKPDDEFNPTRGAHNYATYHCTFLDTNIDYKRKVRGIIADNLMPHISNVLNNYRMLNGSFYVKPSGKGKLEIHENWCHLQDISMTSVTAWIPLMPVTRANGTLEIIEGSHKLVPSIATFGGVHYFKDFEQQLEDDFFEPVDMVPGQCIIFDDTLLHYSRDNSVIDPRVAIQIEIIPAEVNPVLYYVDKQKHPGELEMLEVDSEFFLNENKVSFAELKSKLKSVGMAKDINRKITLDEFKTLLHHKREAAKSL